MMTAINAKIRGVEIETDVFAAEELESPLGLALCSTVVVISVDNVLSCVIDMGSELKDLGPTLEDE
jgi:hypothetical protein